MQYLSTPNRHLHSSLYSLHVICLPWQCRYGKHLQRMSDKCTGETSYDEAWSSAAQLHFCWHTHIRQRQSTRLASKLSHSLQHQGAALISDHVGLEPAASIHSSLRPGALSHVGGRPHLSPRVQPFTSVTHFYMGYYSFYRPRKNKRLSRPSQLAYSGRFTHISGYPSAVGRAQDRERSPVETDILPTVPCSHTHTEKTSALIILMISNRYDYCYY